MSAKTRCNSDKKTKEKENTQAVKINVLRPVQKQVVCLNIQVEKSPKLIFVKSYATEANEVEMPHPEGEVEGGGDEEASVKEELESDENEPSAPASAAAVAAPVVGTLIRQAGGGEPVPDAQAAAPLGEAVARRGEDRAARRGAASWPHLI